MFTSASRNVDAAASSAAFTSKEGGIGVGLGTDAVTGTEDAVPSVVFSGGGGVIFFGVGTVCAGTDVATLAAGPMPGSIMGRSVEPEVMMEIAEEAAGALTLGIY